MYQFFGSWVVFKVDIARVVRIAFANKSRGVWMKMNRLGWSLVLAGIASAPAAFCGQVNIGDIFFIDNGNGTTQFYLDNFTGTTDGCSTPGGFPVCDDLQISGTLSYSYENGSTIVAGSATLAAPIGPDDQNGEAAYGPSNFLLPSIGADIITATFSGSLTPVDFTTDVGPFNSDGTVLSTDVVAGGGFALLYATSASTTVPEPSSALMLFLGGLGSIGIFCSKRHF
jgi:hypothetical protein